MDINVSSNSGQYAGTLREWIAAFRFKIRDGLRLQGKLLCQRLISFTPPRSESQGKHRVEKDIKKVILGLSDMAQFEEVQEGMRQNIIETVGGDAAVRLFARKDGTVYGVDRNLYRPDATMEEISAHHQKYRDSRGRVTQAGSFTRDIGRWKFLDVLVVPQERLEEYIASVRDRVGRAKGGWASGAIALGADVAEWIGIHARTAGAFFDHTTDAAPSMTFQNNSEWASGGDRDRIVENAISSKVRDMASMIKRAARDADFARQFKESHVD